MFKKKTTIRSANFKKDYMTFLAMALFVLMLIGELVIAIGVPVFVSQVDMYAETSRRHEVLQHFDHLRWWTAEAIKINGFENVAKVLNIANPNKDLAQIAPELNLIKWDLDLLAGVLRKHERDLSNDSMDDLSEILEQYNNRLLKLSTNGAKSFLVKKEIDFDLLDKKLNR